MLIAPILALAAASAFEPARLQQGAIPEAPPATVGGGEVLLEVEVDTSGRAAQIRVLRDTVPFGDLLKGAVAGWSFSPAEAEGRPVASRALVAGLFRPPALQYGPSLGEAPRDVAAASEAVAFPSSVVPPPYPPDRVGDAVVLVETEIAADGRVTSARIVRGAPGFDDVAEQTARQWRFRPARRAGSPTRAYAYLVFGFRQPVTPPVSKPTGR
jgi:TonB family protein